ncbi:MAG TPA: acyloxyacyl hydrolase [Lentimicrobium sp.]|nr:acyloxyacyl hydrolase [Lentimicrobium sp.]
METFNAHLPSLEFSLSRSTYGKNQWEVLYHYPVTGITYWNAWLGEPEILGRAHALMPYISFPLIKKDKTEFDFRLSAGMAYLTKRFDRLENYKYIAIGSHLNAAINLMFEYRWKPVNHLQLSGGVQLMHFSNGSMKTPNFGLNIPSLSFGAAFRLNKENPYIKRAIRPALKMYEFDGHEYIEVRIGSGFGIKDISEVSDKRYKVFIGSVCALKSISPKGRAGIGVDFSYDGSDSHYLGMKGVDYQNDFKLVKSGVSLMYEVVLSRMSFPIGVGFYTGGAYFEGNTYFKFSINYIIERNLFLSVNLKTCYAKADYVAFGLGYRFRVKQYWL